METIIAAWIAANLSGQFCGDVTTVHENLHEYGVPLSTFGDTDRGVFQLSWPVTLDYARILQVRALRYDGFTMCESRVRHYDMDNNVVNSDGSARE